MFVYFFLFKHRSQISTWYCTSNGVTDFIMFCFPLGERIRRCDRISFNMSSVCDSSLSRPYQMKNNYFIIDCWARTYYVVALKIINIIVYSSIADSHDQYYVDSLINLVHIRVINGTELLLLRNWLNKLIKLREKKS